MLQKITNNNFIKKLIIISKLVFSDIWGLLLMISSTYIIYIFFKSDRHITGFITGVSCGIIVWFILTRKHWLYPLSYSIIIFAFLITKRAVKVGIAGFYLSEWYGSIELMTLYSTIATILLYKLTKWIEKSVKPFFMFKGLCIALAVAVLFFSGIYGDTMRKKHQIFSTSCNMLIEQLFIMRNNINELVSGDQVDMKLAEKKLDFNLSSTSLLVASFLPENSEGRKFDSYFRNQIKDFIFNYDRGVERGDYKEGISDKERLILLRDFCSKLATDINATYGEIDKAERLFSRVSDSFRALVRP